MYISLLCGDIPLHPGDTPLYGPLAQWIAPLGDWIAPPWQGVADFGKPAAESLEEDTVAILAQGTHCAIARAQVFCLPEFEPCQWQRRGWRRRGAVRSCLSASPMPPANHANKTRREVASRNNRALLYTTAAPRRGCGGSRAGREHRDDPTKTAIHDVKINLSQTPIAYKD